MSWGWLWRRLVALVAVLLFVSVAVYLLFDALPGSTAGAILGPGATPETIEIVEEDLNLNDPLPQRYATWASRAVQGDLGVSYRTGEVVSSVIADRLPTSLELLLLSQLTAVLLAGSAALVSVRREGGAVDRALSTTSFVALALPQFGFGIVLLVVFAQKLDWFPVAQYTRFTDGPLDNLRALVLPVATLSLPLAGIYYRVLRTDLLQTLRSDHITFARAMGLSEGRVILRRALRPSTLTLVSVIGLNTAFLLGGAVVVERLFSLPGLGQLITLSVQTRDIVMVQGATLAVALIYVIINLLVDVALTWLDPRVALARSAA
jgi:peptide/nickel transport system permease protein